MTVLSLRYRPLMLSILRVMTALLFLEHGLMKLVQFPVPQPGVPHPLPALLLMAAGIETIGGTLLLLGLFTRLVAFVAAGQMAFAYFIAHATQGFWPGANGGDAAILFCFILLFLASAGGGPLALDALWNSTPAVPRARSRQAYVLNLAHTAIDAKLGSGDETRLIA